MMRQAHASALRFIPDAFDAARNEANGHGKVYDSRAGLAAYYRYKPRDIAALTGNGHVHVHVTALDRIRWATDGYAPLNLPETFTVVDPDIADKLGVRERVMEHQLLVEASRNERRALRDRAAQLAGRRVTLYYGLIALTLLLVLTLLPSLWELENLRQSVIMGSSTLRPVVGWTSPAVTWVIRNFGSLVSSTIGVAVPGSLEPLIQSLEAIPELVTVFGLLGGLLFWRQRVVVQRMRELGEAMWRNVYSPERVA
jgi:hypothetical protein